MKSNSSASKIDMFNVDILLGIDKDEKNNIIDISICDLYAFKEHPFKVLDDENMEELVSSVKEHGVLLPIMVRSREKGGYEIISGHRRKHACELAGKIEVPAIVKEYTNDQAIMVMVDSNIQRENLLFSEKAFAYKLKLDAIKHQGTSRQLVNKLSVDILSETNDDSSRQIHRYIKLTKLIKPLLEMVDIKKIAFGTGVDIADLSETEQEWLLYAISSMGKYPTLLQADILKRHSDHGELTEAKVLEVMKSSKKKTIQVTLVSDKISYYFPKTYSRQEIESVIYTLLEEWKAKQKA